MQLKKLKNIIEDIILKHGDDHIVFLPSDTKYKPLEKVLVNNDDMVILDFFAKEFN